LDTHGFGMSSVRFICGTQDIHKTLERKNFWILRNRRYYFICSCFWCKRWCFWTFIGRRRCNLR
jgi:glycine C-acetyltransferase